MKIKKCTCDHIITTKDMIFLGRTFDTGYKCLWFNCPKCRSTLIVKGKIKCANKTQERETA